MGKKADGVCSLIGQGSRFEGKGAVNGTLRIDGTYQGDLDVTEALVVGGSGHFAGEVRAQAVVVCGRLEGIVWATGSVELQAGCHYEGEIHTGKFIVHEGVFFQGSCHMDGEASQPSQPQKGAEAIVRPLSQ